MAFLALLKADRTVDDLLSAQALVTTLCNVPRLDTLHALILIAWADFKRERYTEFTAYGRVCTSLPLPHYETDPPPQMAVSMAASLGLTGHTVSAIARDEYDRTILNSTWTSINSLQTYLPSQREPRHCSHDPTCAD